MPLSTECKERIKNVVVAILSSRVDNFPKDASANRNAPFHDAFLRAFRDKLQVANIETPYLVAIASWMHGLNTTLGMVFFENIAHILSGGRKREFTAVQVSAKQAAAINKIIAELKSKADPR